MLGPKFCFSVDIDFPYHMMSCIFSSLSLYVQASHLHRGGADGYPDGFLFVNLRVRPSQPRF